MIDDEEVGFTFEEWKHYGYFVMRGEKATGKNEKGEPTFTKDQVQEWDTDSGRREK